MVPASRRPGVGRGEGRDPRDDLEEYSGGDLYDDDLLDDDQEPREAVRRGRPVRRLTAFTAGRTGTHYMAELGGKDIEGVTLVRPVDDGWKVEVEVVEDHRVPSSGDTLAIYEIDLDGAGDLVAYRRVRSYKRAKGDTGGVG